MMPRDTSRGAGAQAPEDGAARRRHRVLLVEDNRNLRLTTARMLEHLGYSVTAVDNGPAAVELYRRQPPDATILDVGLPGMSGREVLTSIRELVPDARIVLCSGAPEDLAAATNVDGPVERLAKPYDIEALSEALTRVLAD
ncbi:MAG: response regulator [Deltaproteobacteria bacterium]|nr:response regulator [Deltaproteobacteria bacterium]